MGFIFGILQELFVNIVAGIAHLLLMQLKKMTSNFFTGALQMFDSLRGGGLAIEQSFLQEQIDKSDKLPPEVESMKLHMREGYASLVTDVSKYGVKLTVTTDVAVEKFRLAKDERVAVFKVLQKPKVDTRSMLAKLASPVILKRIDQELEPEKLAATADAKFASLLKVDWPFLTLKLEEVPQLQALDKYEFKGKNIWDVVEVQGLEIQHKKLVVKTSFLNVLKAGTKQKAGDAEITSPIQ